MFARWLYGDQASPARLSQIPTAVNTVESTTNLNGRTDCLLGASSIDSSRDHKMPLTGELGPSEERSVAIVDDTDTAGTCEPTLSTIEPTPPTVNRLRTRAVTMSADDMHSSIEAMAILPARPRSCTLSPGASFHPPLTHTIPRLKSSSEASSCYHCGNQFSFYRRKHHCHYCGSVCCYSCTQPRSLLPQFGYYDPVSVCDYCNKFIPLITMPMEELVEQRVKLLRNFITAFDLALETPLPEDKTELASIIVAAQPITDAQERFFRANLPESPIRPAMSLFASSIEQLLLGRAVDLEDIELTPEMLEEREQFEQMLAQLYGFDLQEASASERGASEEVPAEETSPPPPPPISAIISGNIDLETFSVVALRAILEDNCVKVEPKLPKATLIQRVQRLVDNTAREMVKHNNVQPEDDHICRICCDAVINCVFLECGHMATCMSCAKRLQEDHNACPICRDKITRVVHIFRT